MRKIIILFLLMTAGTHHFLLYASSYVVTDYGAASDAVKVQTAVLQDVIDLCSRNGGGTVHIPSGTFVSGTLFLRDNVMLYLDHGAVLKGSADLSDYPGLAEHRKGLIHAECVNNVGICGTGTVDANGNEPVFHSGPKSEYRIYAANFEHCTEIVVKDVSLKNASYWTLRFDDCEHVQVRGVKIHSTSYFNNDGIDIDGRNITISDCIIDCIDDAICLKSYYRDRPCENISITGCIVSSNCNAIKFGTASHGGFRNISISDCIVRRPSQNDYFDYRKYIVPGVTDNYTNNSGIALECVDGGVLEQVVISNITMYNTLTPIFIRLAERRKGLAGTLDGVSISNVTATSSSLMSCSVTGVVGNSVKNIKLSHIILNCPGGGRKEHTFREVPEAERSYPENKIFGADLPAYGFYVRHAENVSFEDIQFNLDAPDERRAIVCEDCSNVSMERVTTSFSGRDSAWSRGMNGRTQPDADMQTCGNGLDLALVKWSFRTRTDILCDIAKEAGIHAIDMVDPEKWDIVIGKGLSVALADGVDMGIERGFCDRRWHAQLQEMYSYYLPMLAARGIRQVVCYSGISDSLSPEEALEVCAEGLGPVVELAEKLGVTLVMELLSSRPSDEIFARHSFPYYQCNSIEWGSRLCRRLDSDNFKLLYDVWHMHDMGHDVFRDIKGYHQYISHYHVSGIPGRSVPGDSDCFDYEKFLRLLRKVGYDGFVGIEPDRVEKNLKEKIEQSVNIFKSIK